MTEYLNFLKQMDMYAAPLPTFNLRGKTSVKSIPGGLLSLLIYIMTGVFASMKFVQLL